MKKILFGSVIAFSLIFSGCSTYQFTARQSMINRQDISMAPAIVDVKPDYSKRVEVTSDWRLTKEDAMNECKYLAITQNKIDVVVDPIYKIEYRPTKLRNRFKATLTGFAGSYTNSRTVYEDMKTLQEFSLEDVEKYLIMQNPEVIKYMNAQGEIINIFHGQQPAGAPGRGCGKPAGKPAAVNAPAAEPAPAPASAAAPEVAPAPKSSSSSSSAYSGYKRRQQ